jgi:hypothetical protein
VKGPERAPDSKTAPSASASGASRVDGTAVWVVNRDSPPTRQRAQPAVVGSHDGAPCKRVVVLSVSRFVGRRIHRVGGVAGNEPAWLGRVPRRQTFTQCGARKGA